MPKTKALKHYLEVFEWVPTNSVVLAKLSRFSSTPPGQWVRRHGPFGFHDRSEAVKYLMTHHDYAAENSKERAADGNRRWNYHIIRR